MKIFMQDIDVCNLTLIFLLKKIINSTGGLIVKVEFII